MNSFTVRLKYIWLVIYIACILSGLEAGDFTCL